VDCFIVRKRKLSLKSAYRQQGHDTYKYNSGFNAVGIACVVVGFICGMLVYNPMTGTVNSPLFYVTTGSGLTAISAGAAYWLASLTPWGKRYLLQDRDELDIV
jgi:NCS1 family nucleobase:cation symporter-1